MTSWIVHSKYKINARSSNSYKDSSLIPRLAYKINTYLMIAASQDPRI